MSLRSLLMSCALAAAALLPAPATHADGASGAYLAARFASSERDYKAAADYYTQALVRDPANTSLMENAIVAYIGAGDATRALPVARRMMSSGTDSQIANMILFADAVEREAWDSLAADIEAGQSVGPLVDGLVAAWAEVGLGRMSEALELFDAVAERSGMQAFGLYHKGLALASVGDFEGADEIFSGAAGAALPPTRRGVAAHVRVLTQLERSADAVELIDTVFGADLDPALEELRAAAASGEALPFTVIRDAADGVAEVFYSVAGALDGEAGDEYTLLYVRMAQHLRSDHSDATLLAAAILERLGRYDLATADYDRIPRDHPAFAAAELGRAEALMQSGKAEAAIEVLEQLAETVPEQPIVHVTLGDMLRRQERYDDATEAYDRALALYGTPEDAHWQIYFARGITHERMDRWEQAEEDFRLALDLEPNQPQVLNYLGYSFVEMGQNLDEALDMIERAVEARPNDGYIVDSLGWVYYRLGRYEEAVEPMERAASLMPIDPIVNDHLGDVYWSVGRQTEARFQWRRALSFDPEPDEAERIRRKLEVGLDAVLREEGADPIEVANDDG